MSDTSAETDIIWKALAEPTRRDVLDTLAHGPQTTGALVERFPDLCRTAVMKHLDVLETAGLLVVRRQGRVRWNYLNPVPIQRIHDRWVSRHVAGIASALSRLKDHVESPARGSATGVEPASGKRSRGGRTKSRPRKTTPRKRSPAA